MIYGQNRDAKSRDPTKAVHLIREGLTERQRETLADAVQLANAREMSPKIKYLSEMESHDGQASMTEETSKIIRTIDEIVFHRRAPLRRPARSRPRQAVFHDPFPKGQ